MAETHLSVRVTQRQHRKLKQAASISGERVSQFIRDAVDEKCDRVLNTQTLDVLLADYVGSLSSEKPGSSGRSEEVFGEILEEKRRAGHL
jgi:hypothetical protein